MPNKHKIINDPVFGFINIPNRIIDVVQHPYVQRLNRIRQLGLSSFVYPGAVHTRFLHSIGAMHLMGEAIAQLRMQGHEIGAEESEAARLAILLHDIGHGPFSHVLENSLVHNISHEAISLLLMQRMNAEMGGKLDMAMDIFKNEYPKHYLHQLVSSQLDTDRLDYLCRDSFFCGVSEGTVASARILKMLNVLDDQLVIEAKGIYSIEKFLVARRLMYWQVYLHKTSVAAEQMLLNIMKRAKWLAAQGADLFASPALHFFLYQQVGKNDFEENDETLIRYAQLDDSDVWTAIKVWASHPDVVLATLCAAFTDRQLYKVKVLSEAVDEAEVEHLQEQYKRTWGITDAETDYFWGMHTVSTDTYSPEDDRINILYNTGEVKDIADASDMLNIAVLTKKVEKNFFYYMKL